MGMFLSQYSMLKSLGYGDDSAIKEETDKILAPYRLFVLVLHDPEAHLIFHRRFSGLFEKLDYLTGRNLLFMGIAKPSYNWFLKKQERDYFGIWEKDQLLRSFHEIKSSDNSIACYSIAKALDIEYDDLPALIVTTNLHSSSFAVLKTDEKTIEKQLTELGYFASSSDDKIILPESDEFADLIKNSDLMNQSEFKNLKEPLATALADSLSFTIGDNSHFTSDATTHARNVLIKQKNELRIIKDLEEAEKIKLKILTNIASRKTNTDLHNFNYKFKNQCISDNYCEDSLLSPADSHIESVFEILNLLSNNYPNAEHESKIILHTTSLVYKFYMEQLTEKKFDYSPLVLGLSKFFEIEINLSAVHWIRKYLKIELPEYFKKHKPGYNQAKLALDSTLLSDSVGTPMQIDFNMGRNKKWLAPGIGQSELILKTLLKQNAVIETFTETEENELLRSWAPVRELRNRASHTAIMSNTDFDKIARQLGLLSNKGHLTKILQLKLKYQGN